MLISNRAFFSHPIADERSSMRCHDAFRMKLNATYVIGCVANRHDFSAFIGGRYFQAIG
jgi:hypothetical protein